MQNERSQNLKKEPISNSDSLNFNRNIINNINNRRMSTEKRQVVEKQFIKSMVKNNHMIMKAKYGEYINDFKTEEGISETLQF